MKMEQKDKLYIFDLDGTLLDTVADLCNAGNHTLAKAGYPTHPLKSYYGFVGNGIGKLMERALPEGHKEEAESLLDEFKSYYGNHLYDETAPYQGVVGILQKLGEAGAKIAVASNKYQAATETLVHHFFPNVNFVSINGQRDGMPRKPDPAVVKLIMEEAGVTKESVTYIGDSSVDMQTAQNAGVKAVAVSWGFCDRKVLEEYTPAFIADNAEELSRYLFQ